MLKQKNEMLLMILIIYLLTMIAFIFLKENTVFVYSSIDSIIRLSGGSIPQDSESQ
jgi:hypothetical protein